MLVWVWTQIYVNAFRLKRIKMEKLYSAISVLMHSGQMYLVSLHFKNSFMKLTNFKWLFRLVCGDLVHEKMLIFWLFYFSQLYRNDILFVCKYTLIIAAWIDLPAKKNICSAKLLLWGKIFTHGNVSYLTVCAATSKCKFHVKYQNKVCRFKLNFMCSCLSFG